MNTWYEMVRMDRSAKTNQQNELSEGQVEKRTRTHLMICSPVEYCLLVTTARCKREDSGRLQTTYGVCKQPRAFACTLWSLQIP